MRYVIGCGRMAAVGIMILVILFILLVLFPLVGRKGRGRCVRRVCRVLMRVLGVRMTVRGAVPVAQRAGLLRPHRARLRQQFSRQGNNRTVGLVYRVVGQPFLNPPRRQA